MKKLHAEDDLNGPVMNAFMKDIKRHESRCRFTEDELNERIMAGDDSARELLVRINMRFVIFVAREYRAAGEPISDLVQEGNYGLMIAAQRYDPTKGFKFISYAVWWIRQMIRNYLSLNSRTIRIPSNVLSQAAEDPDFMESLPHTVLLSSRISAHGLDENSDELVDVLEDVNAVAPDAALLKESLREEIQEPLKTLSGKERRIVEMFYGLSGPAMRCEEIAELEGITAERVRQYRQSACYKLRSYGRRHREDFSID